MTVLERHAGTAPVEPTFVSNSAAMGSFRRPVSTTGWKSWLFTVDHKKLGIMYGVASFVFFIVGGLEALAIRTQLAQADNTFLSAGLYNEMFTMHATTMVFLFVMPMTAAFANYLVPLQIGARDVAFPRINAFGFWCFLVGGIFINTSWFLGGAADGGWFMYQPNANADLLAEPRRRLLGARHPDHRHRLADRRDQPDRHDPQHAGPRDEVDAHAGVHLDGAGHPVPAAVRHPGDHGGPVPAHVPARVRGDVLQRQPGRRPTAVAAPVLDLRSSRGVHPDLAQLRHRQRGAAGVLPQAAVRLQVRRLLRCGHRLHGLGRVGPPHVRQRSRPGERGRVLRSARCSSPSPPA